MIFFSENDDKEPEENKEGLNEGDKELEEKRIRRNAVVPDKWEQFLGYIKNGGPLTHFYKDSLVRKSHKWTEIQLKEIREILTKRESEVYRMGYSLSATVEEMQREICNSKFGTWDKMIRSKATMFANKIHSEVLRTLNECKAQQVPYNMDYDGLVKICQSQTNKNQDQCNELPSLFHCENISIKMIGSVIKIIQEIEIDLPSFEDDLIASRINVFPIPINNIYNLHGKIKVRQKNKIEKRIIKEGKEKTIEELLMELMSRVPERTRRHSTWGMFGSTENKIGLTDKQREFKEAKRKHFLRRAEQKRREAERQSEIAKRFHRRWAEENDQMNKIDVKEPTNTDEFTKTTKVTTLTELTPTLVRTTEMTLNAQLASEMTPNVMTVYKFISTERTSVVI